MVKKNNKSDGADAERKSLERQQAKRNKQAKQKAASAALLTRDVDELERDIRRVEREPASKTTAAKLVELKAALESQRAAKALAEQERLAKHKKRLARKGLKPQDSPYYDAVSNPWGLPPLEDSSSTNKSKKKVITIGPGGKPARPPGNPPPMATSIRFIPPLPSEPWPQDAPIVPHPRQDLIEKDAIDRLVRESERQFRHAERIASNNANNNNNNTAANAVPTRQEMLRREQHAQVHQPVPAASDVRIDPVALRLVPTALRIKRDSSVVTTTDASTAPPKKSARHHEPPPLPPKQLDDAFESFMQDIDNLNS
jgi:hypothetical protein